MSFAPFEAIQIGLASPEMIRNWSHGEVKKPETINYRTLKPERDGLFCEKIFGPTKDWECHCGKYKKIRYKGKICDRCGVEVTKKEVRRERMGHIELAAPVSHIWYFKGIPSRMGLLLDLTPRILEKVLYFASYIVTDPGLTPLRRNQILTEKEYREMREKYEDDFSAGMGAEAIRDLLQSIDCETFSEQLRQEAREAQGQKKAKLIKRLEVVEAFRQSGNDPSWMIIDVLPVIPPEIRPMVQLDGGRFATSDLNDLYRRVINRNNRLKRLIDLKAPDIIVRNEKRMLQEAVDALIDNGRRGRAVTGANSRALKSLSDMLKGKQGRFRQNLLGKRVDYSGRSVIVVGPDLKLYQCGVPKEMAIELFRPFIMKKLVEDGVSNNIKSAKKMVDRGHTEVWDALEVIIKEHPVLLNRAPTLHRLGIQAFEPILVEGRALKLHPLVCSAYNADFDGDQMAIHVPLSSEAQAEARILMLSANNLLHPKDGQPVTVPTQDMILGSYYLTIVREDECATDDDGNKIYKAFSDPNEALMAYQSGDIGIHAPIRVWRTREIDGKTVGKLVNTTIGRIIFNDPIPQDLGFVDRSDPELAFDYEIGFQTGKDQLGKIIKACISKHGFTESTELLDNIKSLGFKYSTRGAITISIADMTVPDEKKRLIKETEQKVVDIERQYKRGFITDDERYRLVVNEWEKTTKEVTAALQHTLSEFNPIYMMANSGARGSMNQIRQLAGMRGLMSNTAGKTIEIPIKANFREGLTVLEYFISSRGARKGLADTALRTADSGYLTRRLVDVSQDVIIREHDCGTHDGIETGAEVDEKSGVVVRTLGEAIHGRYPTDDIVDPTTGEVLFTDGTMLMTDDENVLKAHGITRVKIRTVLDCEAKSGVCAKCYGINLATGDTVSIGEAVGVIAAQSIGEPGTQLTMRTFHTGGVAGDDITQGLPRVEELFEARKPKKVSILSETSGKVQLNETKRNSIVEIAVINEEDGDTRVYSTPYSSGLRVKTGDDVKKGDRLTDGALNPHDVLRTRSKSDAQTYLISEVQRVYRQQSVDINDKHIEVIVRQMMRKVRVEDGGSTELLSGTTVDILELKRENVKVAERIAAGETREDVPEGEDNSLRPATYTQMLMGITKASLATDSFLSAASFQETTKVLTEAAIKGKVDKLVGLKENVIIGKLVPAGSGLALYRDAESKYNNITADGDEIFDIDLSVLQGNAL
ncbi:MAG: DNA-directed RNA polymerase subunit beta' [Oscillospiraceae bacterium]|jgi:DNA-directed RNA polymerase subunit beta'|nr:DNA-directed RNA polymerase subunit beta' [Oscillospiraceae bacterium]